MNKKSDRPARILTFRGSFDVADNSISQNNKIFSYEAADLTRAWKVKEFYVWPETLRADTGAVDGQFIAAASLATDRIKPAGFDGWCSVDDNRQIGWMQKGWNMRDSPVSDFISSPTGLHDMKAILDPDHVINRHLYVNLYTTSDSSTSPSRRWNYLVVLEPKIINENEAILQMVKGVAQNIDN